MAVSNTMLPFSILFVEIFCSNKIGWKKTFTMDSLASRGDFYQKQTIAYFQV